MAVTPIRWIVALLVVIAGVVAFLQPPVRIESLRLSSKSPEAEAHRRAVAQLNRASATLAEARQRDSILSLAIPFVEDSLQIHVAADLPASVEQFLIAQVEHEWSAMRRVSKPVLPAAFVAVRGPPDLPYYRSDYYAMILPSERSHRCVAVMRVGRRRLEQIAEGVAVEVAMQPLWSWWRRPVGLSVCGWYSRFGTPGPSVAHWLAETGDYAGAVPGDSPGRGDAATAPVNSLGARGIGVSGMACSAGNEAACHQALIGETRRRTFRVRPGMPDDMAPVQSVSRGFGPARSHFLADMVADIGPEAFQRFWSSGLAIEDAFREATGAELMEWTQVWARRNIGVVDAGPLPAVATAGMVSLLVLLGLAVGVVAAGKRGGSVHSSDAEAY
jgi:hypothetical protein